MRVHVKFKWPAGAWAMIIALASLPSRAASQQLGPGQCDFDIADELGRFTYGSTMHLTGRSGASSNSGTFFLINADNVDNDADHDGYNQPGTACDYQNIYTPRELKQNLVNVANPALAIPAENIILVNLPRVLPNGTMASVQAFV
jgi:hypothetical protein